MAAVDRDDGIVATKKVSDEAAKALILARNNLKNQKGETMTQKDLANKANVDIKVVKDLERVDADRPLDDKIIKRVEKAANVKLSGKNIGDPVFGPKKEKEPKSA